MATFYCTKYATTKGILEFEGEIKECNGTRYCWNGLSVPTVWLRPGEYFSTLVEAQQDAVKRLERDYDRKYEAADKAQEKLRKCILDGVKVHKLGPPGSLRRTLQTSEE